jgi:fructose-1,6-bisphosphatase I
MNTGETLQSLLAAELTEREPGRISEALSAALTQMGSAALNLARLIAKPALGGRMGAAAGSANSDGDSQKRLDLVAEEIFSDALRRAAIGAYLSEEVEHASLFDPAGLLAVAIDPLDGSSNIDVNAPIGTIFSILPMVPEALEEPALAFRQTGRALLAAGFFVYGPQTSLVVTFGRGVHILTVDEDQGAFVLVESGVTIPTGLAEYAINASNVRHWSAPVRAYVDECLQGKDGPAGRNFNMRWIGSLVADSYRIFMRGGVFLYPGDRRSGYEHGRLRLMYEAYPVAFLAEQAGGGATDGLDPILDRRPTSPHERSPLIMGSADQVERIRQIHLGLAQSDAITAIAE